MNHHYLTGWHEGIFGMERLFGGGYVTAALVLIALGLIVFALLRKGAPGIAKKRPTPLEMLQERFVEGEIGREEYLEKKEILKGR